MRKREKRPSEILLMLYARTVQWPIFMNHVNDITLKLEKVGSADKYALSENSERLDPWSLQKPLLILYRFGYLDRTRAKDITMRYMYKLESEKSRARALEDMRRIYAEATR
jgi:hypothetical protein